MTNTAVMLDKEQQQRAVAAARDYAASSEVVDGTRIVEHDLALDEDRKQLIARELKPLLMKFLDGKVAVPDFKKQVNQINNKHDDWGFTAKKGQMFFNMLVKSAPDSNECDRELKAALAKAQDEDAAKQIINRFTAYVRRVGEDHVAKGGSKQGRPQISSVPYFLSYFWQIHDSSVWPIYYTASVEALESLNLWTPGEDFGENYVAFKRLFEELATAFADGLGKSFDHYAVEHVFWLLWHRQKKADEAPDDKPEPKAVKTNGPEKAVITHVGGDKLPDGYVPPIVAILPRLAKNDASLAEAAKASGTTVERAFEKHVNAAFTILGYNTTLLGQGQGRVPDGRAVDQDNSYAILWDGKVRSSGYGMGTDDRTIREYVNTQTRELKRRNSLRNIYYVIVSSGFDDDCDDSIRALKMETEIKEVVLLEAEALVAMVDLRLRRPHDVDRGPGGFQRLFSSSGIITADDVRKMFS